MAIYPVFSYPSQCTVSADYPLGGADNVVVDGDGIGWPLEKKWVRDIQGFQQALLAAAGATANDDADTALNSQYLAALQRLFGMCASYEIAGTAISPASLLSLAENVQRGGFVLASDEIEVPAPGTYLVSVYARVQSSDTSNPAGPAIVVMAGASAVIDVNATRFSATPAHVVSLIATTLVVIATPASQKISLVAAGLGDLTVPGSQASRLTLQRVSQLL